MSGRWQLMRKASGTIPDSNMTLLAALASDATPRCRLRLAVQAVGVFHGGDPGGGDLGQAQLLGHPMLPPDLEEF